MNEEYVQMAQEFGRQLAYRGLTLVYGGGKVGLMGAVADAALEAGGYVVGVIPQHLVNGEVVHPGLTELHVVDNMLQRKQMMAELSDAFVALPGGTGTLDEVFDVYRPAVGYASETHRIVRFVVLATTGGKPGIWLPRVHPANGYRFADCQRWGKGNAFGLRGLATAETALGAALVISTIDRPIRADASCRNFPASPSRVSRVITG